jgi:hypothetical protein
MSMLVLGKRKVRIFDRFSHWRVLVCEFFVDPYLLLFGCNRVSALRNRGIASPC